MITPNQSRIVAELGHYADEIMWNRADHKAFRWLWYLATVATGHTWTEHERIVLRQLRRKYCPYKPAKPIYPIKGNGVGIIIIDDNGDLWGSTKPFNKQ